MITRALRKIWAEIEAQIDERELNGSPIDPDTLELAARRFQQQAEMVREGLDT